MTITPAPIACSVVRSLDPSLMTSTSHPRAARAPFTTDSDGVLLVDRGYEDEHLGASDGIHGVDRA